MIIAVVVIIVVVTALVVRVVQINVNELSESIDCTGFIGQDD